ncbi:HlyD family type I secretion periplasmic adaptor subunit [Novosphingobium sp.]|uniref:HlyD family type I secretion periplasmic adaptor subunit n=1 Tax=Novosphingobium sp. TaxID=1874826 RepID=UPI00262D6692|nr:HlyD family type I secretion periplasmic adaptor subunit [Novosphingobium sp.]
MTTQADMARADPANALFPSKRFPADDDTALRRKLAIAGALFMLLVLAAAIVPIGGAVIGAGQVGVVSRVKRISHPVGGVVASIEVSNGEHVSVGQILVRLDNKVLNADALNSNLTVEQLLARRSRLEAESAGQSDLVFPPELTNAPGDAARQAMAQERRLFTVQQTEQSQLAEQLRERIEQFRYNIGGLEAQIAALRSQRRLIDPELRSVRELWDQNLVTISRVNQMERTAVDLEGNIAAQQAQIAQMRARINETRSQLIQLGSSRRVQAGEELAKTNAALNEQRTKRVAALDQNTRSEIRAPYSGTVEKIAFAAVGEVIRPAETILEIVPDRDLLVVEAMVSPTDVDQVRQGQLARIRFSAFNRATTPEIPGRVSYVSSVRTENVEARQAYFTARIEIDRRAVEQEGLKLINGMPAEVYIETASRSLLSYFTKPLRDQIARSFRDN